MTNFQPRSCLEDDLETVRRARSVYDARVRVLYSRYAVASRRAAAKADKALRTAAHDWLHEAEMVVATDYDIVRFKAQIRYAEAHGRDPHGLCKTLGDLLTRNQDARKALPAVEAEFKRILQE